MDVTASGSELNQEISKARRAAEHNSVIITDRGKPAFVLLSYAEYQRLTGGQGRSIVDALSMPGLSDIEFDPPKADIQLRPADLP